MRSSNPALNDRVFAAYKVSTATLDRPQVEEAWRTRMTLDGVVLRSATLLAIVLATGWIGWRAAERAGGLPGWVMLALLGGLGVAIFTIFKPDVARYTAPVYAALEGFLLGAVSAIYAAAYEGIVLQAVMLTAGVFGLMLFLHGSGIIRVTDKFRLGVVAATGAVFLVYMVSFVMRLFGADMPMIHEASTFGILFSLAVVGIAALNLVLDFDFIRQGTEAGLPKHLEWYAAFSLLVTLVWLYLELLRLLAKLRER